MEPAAGARRRAVASWRLLLAAASSVLDEALGPLVRRAPWTPRYFDSVGAIPIAARSERPLDRPVAVVPFGLASELLERRAVR
jgi:hypothetical protein